nr:replication initiator [Kutzneria buriramensis]WKX12001.1 LysE family transporter [Kutzneria buriramensis]
MTTSHARSADLEREKRLRMLSDTDRDIIRLANDPLFPRWLEQIQAIGGCAHPVYLSGSTLTRDAVTGEVISSYSTAGEPGERLAVRCRNRRASVCEPCAYLHAGDTFQLIRAGLSGGKNVPAAVRDRPRLFVTLTAPSFGPVHRVRDGLPGYAYPALSFVVLGAFAQLASFLYLTALIFSGTKLATAFRRRRRLSAGATSAAGALFLGFAVKLSLSNA